MHDDAAPPDETFSDALAPEDLADGDAEPWYRLDARGLTVLREPSTLEYLRFGKREALRTERGPWVLGDWLVYGARQDTINRGYARWLGSGYAKAAALTGYSPSHLANLYSVAKAFTPEQRAAGPAVWSLYREVLTQPEARRMELLLLAKAKRWTLRDLHDHLAAITPPTGAPLSAKRVRYAAAAHVQCPQCGHVFPIKPHRHAAPPREPLRLAAPNDRRVE